MDVNWFAGIPDPTAAAQKSSAFINALADRAQQQQDRRTQEQAGAQYASGDYAGSAKTIASMGNIGDAQKIQAAGAQANAGGIQYLAKALPVFQQIAAAHAQEGPQGQAQALTAAFDHIAPEAKQLTGVSDQVLMGLRQGFATDPQGTLARLQAQIPTEFKTVGDSLVPVQGNQILSDQAYQGAKYQAVGPGQNLYQVGGAASSPQPLAGAAPNAPPPVASGGTDILASLTPQTVAQVESGGDPNAVSPVGATGTMQTMPGTLASPGYGVAPAADNSPQEQTRVGQDYLAAMGHQFGNPVYQAIAYNWGPGNTQKWIQGGAHWDQLPRETRDYLGRMALAQVAGRQPPQMPSQAQPQQQGSARLVASGGPAVPRPVAQGHAPSAAEKQTYPGAAFIEPSGRPVYPNAAQQAASTPVDAAVDYFIQSGGKFPPGMRNPAASMRILEGAKAVAAKSGQKLSDIIGYGAERQANASTLTQLTQLRGKIGTYIATFDKNLDSLRSVIPKGAGGSVPIINRWVQAGRKEIQGDPDVARLNTWMTAVRDEYARILSGATGGAGITDAARNEADGIISKIDSVPAMYATLDAMHSESRNRVNAIDTAISDLHAQLRSGSPSKPAAPQSSQSPQQQKGTQSTVIRYDAQGNRIQ